MYGLVLVLLLISEDKRPFSVYGLRALVLDVAHVAQSALKHCICNQPRHFVLNKNETTCRRAVLGVKL